MESSGISFNAFFLFQAQVHLMGNIILWYTGTISVLAYSALLAFYLLRRRRQCFDIPEGKERKVKIQVLALKVSIFSETFQHFVEVGEVLLAGYLFHFLPFFFYDRTLFLHHYLLAYIFKLMLTAFIFSHVYELLT